MMKMNEEIWKSVMGFGAGYYQVSNLGRVRSLDRTTTGTVNGVTVQKSVKGRVLKLLKRKKDYRAVSIWVEGVFKPRLVHHLVLEAFIGLRPAGKEGGHLDGHPSNNRLDNLKWVTSVENQSHKKLHGTMPRGPTHWRSIGRQL